MDGVEQTISEMVTNHPLVSAVLFIIVALALIALRGGSRRRRGGLFGLFRLLKKLNK